LVQDLYEPPREPDQQLGSQYEQPPPPPIKQFAPEPAPEPIITEKKNKNSNVELPSAKRHSKTNKGVSGSNHRHLSASIYLFISN
jgi:hypothetical protein